MAFYDRAEWNTARRQALHNSGYRCQRCGTSLIGLGKACHVHHRKELRRAPALRSEPLNLMSVCRSCHTVLHNEAKRPLAVNVDGTPNDPNHPWFRRGNRSIFRAFGKPTGPRLARARGKSVSNFDGNLQEAYFSGRNVLG